jgi:two-component system, cell cycle sensor histidine kinase and response regulator CckA
MYGHKRAASVLVVNDNLAHRQIAKSILEAEGYSVFLASCTVAAQDVFRKHASEISLVLLDLAISDSERLHAVRGLRAIRPSVPVIALVDASYARSRRTPGFIEILEKPYTASELLDIVESALAPPVRVLTS